MNQKQKETVVQKMLQTLADHNVCYSEVSEILASLESELRDLCQQQVITLS